jgi:hypothetical protein
MISPRDATPKKAATDGQHLIGAAADGEQMCKDQYRTTIRRHPRGESQ